MKHHLSKKILEKLNQNPEYFTIQEVFQETKPSRIVRHKDKKSKPHKKQNEN